MKGLFFYRWDWGGTWGVGGKGERKRGEEEGERKQRRGRRGEEKGLGGGVGKMGFFLLVFWFRKKESSEIWFDGVELETGSLKKG